MKIDTANATREILRRSAAPDQPAQQFAAYLEGRLPDGLPSSRALGFGELGMFGVFAPIEFRTEARTPPRQVAALPRSAEMLDASAAAPTGAAGNVQSGIALRRAAAPPQALPGLAFVPMNTSPRLAGGLPAPADCAAPGSAETQEQHLAASRRGAPLHARPRPLPQSKLGLCLILSDQEGQLEIVAGGPPLEPEARRRALRLAGETAASFGLTIGHYSLNGVSLASARDGAIGRFHGTRTR